MTQESAACSSRAVCTRNEPLSNKKTTIPVLASQRKANCEIGVVHLVNHRVAVLEVVNDIPYGSAVGCVSICMPTFLIPRRWQKQLQKGPHSKMGASCQ